MASNVSCPSPMKVTSNGLFQGDNPMDFALPLAILQIVIVLSLTRILAVLLRPLKQPRVIAEIIGGILLGPSALGRNKEYLQKIFPAKSLTVMDTLANLGLLFFLFLVGLELDLKAIRRTGKKALGIAAVGITLPFLMGIGTSLAFTATISKGVEGPAFIVFMGVAVSITAFPVLARILAELKLLATDVGRMAMSVAAVNDVAAWALLALAIALSGDHTSPIVALWVFLCGGAFLLACSFAVPRMFRCMARRCTEGEPVKEVYICTTLAAVLAAGFVTDLIGIHALFGAFVMGVFIPKEGPFARALVDKVHDLVSGLFLPLYFVSSGLKTNVATISGAQSWGLLGLVIGAACFGKIVGTVGVSLLCKIPCRQSFALGFLMNTKGLVELIVLNIGKDRKVLNDQTFAIMVLMAIFTTFITTPIVTALYKPHKRQSKAYKDRSVQSKDPNTELRILACFYGIRNIPTMLNLIEASRGTQKRECLRVYALHLLELTERRSSAISLVHRAHKSSAATDSDQLVVDFEEFQQLSRVSVRPMTAISAMARMHEDICESAEGKRAAVIILPFHKHQRLDGSLVTTSDDLRAVNCRVLDRAPCSVGILVDRGLGGTVHVAARNVSSAVVVLFFGGKDDREALAFGVRTAQHPGISLTVVRFLAGPTAAVTPVSADEGAISELKLKEGSNDSIKYEERTVESSQEAVEAIREYSKCNLFVVGRAQQGLLGNIFKVMKSDCPEIGPIGNLLTCSEFSTSASVLILQQKAAVDQVLSDDYDLEANIK